MKKLYEKSPLWFALIFIAVYVVGSSFADRLSASIGFAKSVTLPFNILLAAVIYLFVSRNGLGQFFGLRKPEYSAKKFLFFVPLAVIASVNLWDGVQFNMPFGETLCYAGSMLCVGFIEELIFRGFLFRAMCRDNVNVAIAVSSITFGLGHIVNLINGSGTDIVAGLCQVCYAVAIGFMFVTLFYRGKSIWPCVITHSIFNALSVFSSQQLLTDYQFQVSAALLVLALAYSLYLMKSLPAPAAKVNFS